MRRYPFFGVAKFVGERTNVDGDVDGARPVEFAQAGSEEMQAALADLPDDYDPDLDW